MNTSQLKSLLSRLAADEEKFQVQSLINDVHSSFTDLVEQPAESKHQTALAEALEALDLGLNTQTSWYNPGFRRQLAELDLLPYFSETMVTDIRRQMSENPLTPAVALKVLDDWKIRREAVLHNVYVTLKGLRSLALPETTLGPGEAEVGFTIPRSIFENSLDGLVGELRDIRRIIRAYSERASGSVEVIEVREISTTDPTFFFGVSALTVALIGGAVTWAIATWKNLEEIRKIRAEIRKLKGFQTDDLDKIFEERIQTSVDKAITEHVDSLLGNQTGEAGRVHEQRTDLIWANRALFARVERGMIVEIRFIPPPTPEPDSSSSERSTEATAPQPHGGTVFDLLDQIAGDLNFPQIDDAPVLALPTSSEEK